MLGVVREVAAVGSRDEFDAVVLEQVTNLVRSDVTTLNEVDPPAGRVAYLTWPETFVFSPEAVDAFAELAAQHPLIGHHLQSGDGSAIKIGDFLGVQAWHATEIYQRFFSQVGVEHQMSITLPAPSPIVVGIAVNRLEDDFGERDRAVLNLVRPHLAQSWRRAREYERVELLLSAAAGALARGGAGVIVLADPLHELTPGALVSLYRFFGRPAPRDVLPVRVRRWLDACRAQAAAAENPLEMARPLRASLDGRRLVLRHLPVKQDRADVILLDERPADAPAGTLVSVGLTDRESQVVGLVASGASNAEIARQMSLSPWTVKRHLANVYAKLGIRNRAAAAALALEIDAHHHY